jgi:hypothetical protein
MGSCCIESSACVLEGFVVSLARRLGDDSYAQSCAARGDRWPAISSFAETWRLVQQVNARGSRIPPPDHELLSRRGVLEQALQIFKTNWTFRGLPMSNQHCFLVVVDGPGLGKTRIATEIVAVIRNLGSIPSGRDTALGAIAGFQSGACFAHCCASLLASASLFCRLP